MIHVVQERLTNSRPSAETHQPVMGIDVEDCSSCLLHVFLGAFNEELLLHKLKHTQSQVLGRLTLKGDVYKLDWQPK